MKKNSLKIQITIYLIIMFLLCSIYISLLFATLMITTEAIIGIIIYYIQKLKKNSSVKTKIILLITYIFGAILGMILTEIYSPLLAITIEIIIFLTIIYFTNKKLIKIYDKNSIRISNLGRK